MTRSKDIEESQNSPFYSRIGRRIILIMVLLSGLITVFTTLLQLSWDYRKEFDTVKQRQFEIRDIHAPIIASSVWDFDLLILQQEIDGLVNLPRVDYLRVESGGYTFEAGTEVIENAITKKYPLIYKHPNTSRVEEIGHIYVQSDAQEIYDYLIWQAVYTLLLNAGKTLLVCYLVLMVFHRSVNQRIFAIAKYLRKYNPRHPADPLELEHQAWISEKDDELDWLAEEANKITSNVTRLYDNIKQEQERLKEFAHVSSDWLWETDELGHLVYCSDSMREALGIDSLSKPVMNQLTTLEHCTSLHGKLRQRSTFSMCEETITLNCITQYLLFQAKARYESDRFLGFRGTAINITELKLTQIELEELNQNLEHTVATRTLDLKQSMEQLKHTQEQLVESEKLAALGGLVAGVAHEVNTPLGIAVTATSVIRDVTHEANQAFASQTLTTDQFKSIMERMSDSSTMLEHNLNRAAKLIRDFKQTAVDQVSESRSQFQVFQVLDALIASLHPETRKLPVVPVLEGDASLTMNSLPGVLTQVISNLIMNSINHAFHEQSTPQISIRFHQDEDTLVFEYRDNGNGIEASLHQKIFEPFYTTKRGKGGSGLGLNLVFNLVKQKLKGELIFESELGQGVRFELRLPRDLPSNDSPDHHLNYNI
ncbi:ATP-binding protein [Vibrio tubiashii]|uniref:PAS domain-containing sensor histidine kinase n=1 Tax=Vibrio tubiashii TaxID=29498 RepID=UPI001EFCE72E|nr:ATP-binding protein [Vibrio tubiashii]MCG9580387.1 ATP-binding protein [Vibrio tubiashii]MCG9613978.1 ATP-binding protein [Vibrio tubiashii]MCG9687597.1 ATP-binding protein [Vibrio tubiashii]